MLRLFKITLFSTLILVVLNFTYANPTGLTNEQRILLSASIQEGIENFEAFRSTLDVFQLAIVHDNSLSSTERMLALRSSLTIEQEALLEATKVLENSLQEEFQETLSAEQKLYLPMIIENSIDQKEEALIEANRILRGLLLEDVENKSDQIESWIRPV